MTLPPEPPATPAEFHGDPAELPGDPNLIAGMPYRHHKGGAYAVVGIGRLEADLAPAVVYRALRDPALLWVRRADVFTEPVTTPQGEVPRSPIVMAFQDSWRDMLRVVCMSLMNVIPVVATVFGAAYAVQAAYGIGFRKDIYLWIPVLGNMLVVIVIPFVGSLSDLRRPDAVIIDKAGYEYMWPGEEYKIGREFELNDHRAVLVGVCKASAPFTTLPVLYTRYSQTIGFVPRERNLMTFVLAEPQPGVSAEELCRRIESQTGLLAQTKQTAEFSANLFEAFTLATLIYFTLNMSLMLFMRLVEKKVAVPGLISVGGK